MKLDVLASRDMPNLAGGPLGEIRQDIQLLGGQPSPRDLDAEHLFPLLALAVDAVLEAKALKLLLRNLLLPEPLLFFYS